MQKMNQADRAILTKSILSADKSLAESIGIPISTTPFAPLLSKTECISTHKWSNGLLHW
jgi:hypothetical protein